MPRPMIRDVTQNPVNITKQGASTSHHNTFFNDVCCKLWRCLLKRHFDTFNNLTNRI